MKSFISCFVLCGLVVLAGCGGDSAKTPTVPPGGNDDVWLITALEVTNPSPLVGTAVTVVATVTLNGSAAPDGTKVEFLANGGAFLGEAQLEVDVLTSGGQADVGFVAADPGTYAIQARVHTVTSTTTLNYRNPSQSDNLQIYYINPPSGTYDGDATVVLEGKGIRAPAEVSFRIQNLDYQAIVQFVEPSDPLSSTGSITIVKPRPTGVDTTVADRADITVKVGVGTGDEESLTLVDAFYFQPVLVPPDDEPPTPMVFGVDPYYGRSLGGETVTILGYGFQWDRDGVTEDTFSRLAFRFRSQDLAPEVVRVSESQIEVVTPRFSAQPLDADENAAVVIVPTNGDPEVVREDAFIVRADVATPEITGLSPTAGPMDGGTVVTISGHGFQLPLQVHFGDLEASDVQLYDDPSIADNDVITCVTPDYSQLNQTPPLSVSVRVTNLQSGLSATATQTFRYGDSLYITQANPTEGQIGDQFALYGAGFEDPLTVWFRAGGDTEFDVLQVTGTELVLRSPPDMAPTCTDRTGDFQVVLNESGQTAEGGVYTLIGNNPTITSVDPIFVQEMDNGDGVVPGQIDIYGVRFADELLVLVDNYTIDPNDTLVESSEHIHVFQIPAPNDFGLVFNTTSCTTDTGLQGIKEVATPVDVTVRNLPLGCQDTLTQTLVYQPQDDTCIVAPSLAVTTPGFSNPPTPAGTCSPPQPLIITNNGAGTLEVQSLFLQGRFFFDAGVSQNAGPLTVPPFSFDDSLNLYFCPDEPTGAAYPGQLVITSNNPGSPNNYPLSGTEATPPEIGTAPYGDGDTRTVPDTTSGNCSAPQSLTVTNTGVSDLSITSATTTDPQFNITATPPGTLNPGDSADLTIEFCPTAAGAVSATLNIDHDAINEPDPIAITLDGNGT